MEEIAKGSQKDLVLLHAITKVLGSHKEIRALVETLSGSIAGIKEGRPGRTGLPGPRVDEAALEERLATRIIDILIRKLPNEEKIYRRLAKLIPQVQDGRPGRDAVIDQNALFEGIVKKLKPEHINGLEQSLNALFHQERQRMGYIHGGGDTVEAGSGITITSTASGRKTIAASASANIATEKLTPTTSGANITLNLALLAHTFSTVLGVYKNGQLLDPAATDFGWSRSSNTITVLNAANTDTFLVQYTYA